MTEAEFDELLALGEKQRTEYKAPGRATDKSFIARIARAVLGMANRRAGGLGAQRGTVAPGKRPAPHPRRRAPRHLDRGRPPVPGPLQGDYPQGCMSKIVERPITRLHKTRDLTPRGLAGRTRSAQPLPRA